ncbi:hypothetical protein B0H17DRAFT_1244946 [Mycena rosella]|uniref:Uncharacterized protein n=1 Tax=Mycena rosella TaxID=1033263 RepID=A0AAD7CZN8_MYCRO|nr:hypothetical protein B0H17DRAFT_1244946 [Mycena rosella]
MIIEKAVTKELGKSGNVTKSEALVYPVLSQLLCNADPCLGSVSDWSEVFIVVPTLAQRTVPVGDHQSRRAVCRERQENGKWKDWKPRHRPASSPTTAPKSCKLVHAPNLPRRCPATRFSSSSFVAGRSCSRELFGPISSEFMSPSSKDRQHTPDKGSRPLGEVGRSQIDDLIDVGAVDDATSAQADTTSAQGASTSVQGASTSA